MIESVVDRKRWLHPLVCFTAVWIAVLVLYLFRLSGRLNLELATLALPVVLVLSGFWLGSLIALLIFKLPDEALVGWGSPSQLFSQRLLMAGLLLLLVAEFAYSGYVPIIAKIQGRDVSHFEFGIPSVHGVVLAGVALLFTLATAQRLMERRFLSASLVMGFGVAIAVAVVSRKLFMVLGFQTVVMAAFLLPAKQFAWRALAALVCLFGLFGVVGEIRSSGIMDEYAQIPRNSLLGRSPAMSWVYMYATTPLHNLGFAVDRHEAEHNLIPERTFKSIIPSVLRKNQDIDTRRNRFQIAAVERYWLESSVFNVSTAFIGPYLDWGKWGIWLAAFTLGLLCSSVFSTFHSMEGLAGIVILTTACLLSVYADSFTNLNFIGQFAWLVLLMLIANVYRSMARRRAA